MGKVADLLSVLGKPGTELRCFDLGRRISAIPLEQFSAFEAGETAYPLPLQNQAWFALCRIDTATPAEPLIWFLRLPLDEQGKLVLAARDYFVHRLLDSIAQSEPGVEDPLAGAFKDNPHTFKPREDRMAVFHALLNCELALPPSGYYEHAVEYFSGNKGWDQWQFVGYQGIADVAIRAQNESVTLLADAIPYLPTEPLTALCHCLEHQPLPERVALALLKQLRPLLDAAGESSALISALIRGLSQAEPASIRQQVFDLVIGSPYRTDIEILVAIAGRGWEVLESVPNALQFLEALAENLGGQQIFEECTRDLLRLPGMRPHLLAAIDSSPPESLLSSRFEMLKQQISDK
ncbi:MAG: DUF3549 family protein [bacterium]